MEVPLERFKVDSRHKWLYSVVPDFPSGSYPGGIFLAGFCPICRNAFTVRLKTAAQDGNVLIEQLGVPVEGCQPV